MRSLAERQHEFASALLDPRLSVPGGCVAPDGRSDSKRFAVYRNNVVSSLIEALEAGYPAVKRLLGEECFRETARRYAVHSPPRSPVMLEYGACFPVFLADFEPLASLPYLADVARIERAWLEAYHARDAEPIDPETLGAVAGDRAGELRLSFHPSVRIVRSRFPALTIWRMNVSEGATHPVSLETGGEDALIARPELEVEVRALPPAGARFLCALLRGEMLAKAAQTASGSGEPFELSEHLAALLAGGVLTGARLRRRRPKGAKHVESSE